MCLQPHSLFPSPFNPCLPRRATASLPPADCKVQGGRARAHRGPCGPCQPPLRSALLGSRPLVGCKAWLCFQIHLLLSALFLCFPDDHCGAQSQHPCLLPLWQSRWSFTKVLVGCSSRCFCSRRLAQSRSSAMLTVVSGKEARPSPGRSAMDPAVQPTRNRPHTRADEGRAVPRSGEILIFPRWSRCFTMKIPPGLLLNRRPIDSPAADGALLMCPA